MVKMRRINSEGNPETKFESRVFYSTSDYGELPQSAPHLFVPLVSSLKKEWAKTFEEAKRHQTDTVRSSSTKLATIH